MVLNSFRKGLLNSIERVKSILANEYPNPQEIQQEFSAIANSLRQILTRLPAFACLPIDVLEREAGENGRTNRKKETLKFLVESISHYQILSYGWIRSARPSSMESIAILSDRDKHLHTREIKTSDFIQIAETIAKDDGAILNTLLTYTIECLKCVIKLDTIHIFKEMEVMESLFDVFALIKKSETQNLPKGAITVFHEISNSESVDLISIQPEKIEYETLFGKLLAEWQFCILSWKFQPYEGNCVELNQCKVLYLRRVREEYPDISLIRIKDLLELLNNFHEMEKKM